MRSQRFFNASLQPVLAQYHTYPELGIGFFDTGSADFLSSEALPTLPNL